MVAVVTCLLGCARRSADGGGPAQPPTASAPAPPAPAGPVRVSRAALIERLRMPLSRSSDGLRFEPHGAHGQRLRLQGRAQHAMVARIDESGQLQMSCVDSPEAAERALTGVAAAR
jgi:hypothetical protein